MAREREGTAGGRARAGLSILLLAAGLVAAPAKAQDDAGPASAVPELPFEKIEPGVRELGLGEIVILDVNGRPVSPAEAAAPARSSVGSETP